MKKILYLMTLGIIIILLPLVAFSASSDTYFRKGNIDFSAGVGFSGYGFTV